MYDLVETFSERDGLPKEAWELMFRYDLFRKLYEAPLFPNFGVDGEEAWREVGRTLNDIGGVNGKVCMQIHYYMVNYAMCGQYFYQGRRSRVILCLCPLLNSVWDGIGEWVH